MFTIENFPINKLTFQEQSYMFALCSKYAYYDLDTARPLYKKLGLEATLVDHNHSQAYFLKSKYDLVIVCRGTQPTHLADIQTDLQLDLTDAQYGAGQVHRGFKRSVRNIWDNIATLVTESHSTQDVWCCGHSLGGAMATLISSYLLLNNALPNVRALFTYGSPSVGDEDFTDQLTQLALQHNRFINSIDVIPYILPSPYQQHADSIYMNHWGNIRPMTRWQRTKDRVRGSIIGISRGGIDFFKNHQIERYCINLERWSRGEEREQTLFY